MSSSFMGLYVQRESLNIAQKALDITGNNISNIHTSGYTRQQVDIVSIANSKGTLGYNTSIALAGQGSEAMGVAQIRDRLLDKRVREYSGDLCCIGVKANTLSDVEDVFDSIESDDNNADVNRGASLAYFVSNFKYALQSFSADNADRSELANVAVNAAQSVVQCVVTYDKQLDDIAARTLEDADKTIDKINDILAQMGNLNKEIKASYVQMGYLTPTIMNYEVMNKYGPLELKDTMNSLLDELGQYGNIAFKEEADGTFTVDFAGQRVVEEKYYAQMAVTTTNPAPTELEYEVSNLMEKDDWYKLHVDNGTGGDSQELIRKGAVGISTFNFSGVDSQGVQYLDSGALRGYLDMYNGRGIYAHEEKYTTDSIKNTQPFIDKVNTILSQATLNPGDANLLKSYIGADTAADGTVTLDGKTLNGKTIVLTEKGAYLAEADGTLGEKVTLGGSAREEYVDISNNEKGIEYYRDMLNAFAKTATEEFNGIFAGLGNNIELFTYADKDGNNEFRTAAENFRVADCWKNNPEVIANPTGNNIFTELDNTYINKMIAVFEVELEYGDGTVSDPQKFGWEKYVQHICDDLGSEVSSAQSLYDATDVALTGQETARSEVMDVSLNEEGINMINYQKWYNAISRMVTTLDEALEKLINGTGVVGLR